MQVAQLHPVTQAQGKMHAVVKKEERRVVTTLSHHSSLLHAFVLLPFQIQGATAEQRGMEGTGAFANPPPEANSSVDLLGVLTMLTPMLTSL